MSIKVGEDLLNHDKVFVGDQQISAIYKGSEQVWPITRHIEPGDSIQLSTNEIKDISIVKINDTHWMIAYHETSTNKGYVKIFEVDSNYELTETSSLNHDTTVASRYVYTEYKSTALLKIAGSSTRFLLAYAKTNLGTTQCYVKLFSIDGSYNITQEDDFNIGKYGHSLTLTSLTGSGAVNVLLTYRGTINNAYYATMYVNLSTDVISSVENTALGYTLAYPSAIETDVARRSILVWSGYSSNRSYAQSLTSDIAGSLTKGTGFDFSDGDTHEGFNSTVFIGSTKFISARNSGTIDLLNISATDVVTSLDSLDYISDYTQYNSLIKLRTDTYLLSYRNATTTGEGKLKLFSVDSDVISLDRSFEFDSDVGHTALATIDDNYALLIYGTDGGSTIGKIQVINVTD